METFPLYVWDKEKRSLTWMLMLVARARSLGLKVEKSARAPVVSANVTIAPAWTVP